MKYDEDYSNGHINLFAPNQTERRKPKSILKHTNYRTKNGPKVEEASVSKTFEDLNIQGYSSNIYRDDFTALKIESREYLIPWNGDQSLLIDKYDCRLFLYDLKSYDADLIAEPERNAALSHEENETEVLCDFERYLDLAEDENQTDPDQSDMSGKRGAAIGYVYESDSRPEKDAESNQTSVNKNEKLFIPDQNLKLPVDMIWPETVKLNQLIVKTANFIAKQGLQAEILLKTKQSANIQFNFLNHGDQLHPYYKHLIGLIQDNKIDPVFYLQQESENKPSPQPMSESESESDEDGYLHPLLSNALNRTPSANSITKDQEPLEKELDEDSCHSEANGSKKDEAVVEEPSGNEKIMIDKLAEYVYRNGPEFEDNLRKKNDSRFDFLNSDHIFYKYYKLQIDNLQKKKKEDETPKSKRRHKSSRREHKKTDGTSETDSSDSSASTNSEAENEKKRDRKRSKEKKKHKRHRSRSDKSSSRRRHDSSKKKHKKTTSS